MKGLKNAQETIFTISVILIVAVSVVMTYVYLESIKIPEKFENHLTGNSKDISEKFAEYIIKCYRSRHSMQESAEECYVLHVRAESDLSTTDILSKIPKSYLAPEKIRFSENTGRVALAGVQTTFRITYIRSGDRIEITRVDDIL